MSVLVENSKAGNRRFSKCWAIITVGCHNHLFPKVKRIAMIIQSCNIYPTHTQKTVVAAR